MNRREIEVKYRITLLVVCRVRCTSEEGRFFSHPGQKSKYAVPVYCEHQRELASCTQPYRTARTWFILYIGAAQENNEFS
jgi:hypothetical protein